MKKSIFKAWILFALTIFQSLNAERFWENHAVQRNLIIAIDPLMDAGSGLNLQLSLNTQWLEFSLSGSCFFSMQKIVDFGSKQCTSTIIPSIKAFPLSRAFVRFYHALAGQCSSTSCYSYQVEKLIKPQDIYASLGARLEKDLYTYLQEAGLHSPRKQFLYCQT